MYAVFDGMNHLFAAQLPALGPMRKLRRPPAGDIALIMTQLKEDLDLMSFFYLTQYSGFKYPALLRISHIPLYKGKDSQGHL